MAYHDEDIWGINGRLKVDLVENIALAKKLECLDMPDYDLILSEITPFRLDMADMLTEIENWDEARRLDMFDMPDDSEWPDHGPGRNVEKRVALKLGSMFNADIFCPAFWLNHKEPHGPEKIDNLTPAQKSEQSKADQEQRPAKRGKRKQTQPSVIDRFKKTHRIK